MDRHGWDERYGATTEGRMFPVGPTRFVEAEVAGLPPGRAVDLATGEGRHAVWLAGLGWHVVAVDYSGVGVCRARAWAAAEGGRRPRPRLLLPPSSRPPAGAVARIDRQCGALAQQGRSSR